MMAPLERGLGEIETGDREREGYKVGGLAGIERAEAISISSLVSAPMERRGLWGAC
jgi:hypothetical protein